MTLSIHERPSATLLQANATKRDTRCLVAQGGAYRPMVFDMGKPLVDLTKALSLAQDFEDQEALSKHRRRE